ncbi:SWIM zinc finger family protein [Streptomyces sp. NPDC101151]|uniref:SWIM zinc finger family protein n=1 Tax=Streptomyces sp. NPDC101151 TaxID=3366115 RepID=UPI003815BD5C
MTTGEQRPGDAARQALRAARERTETDREEPAEETTPERAAEQSGTVAPRPADAVRAALRSAAPARRGEDARTDESGDSGGTADRDGTGAMTDSRAAGDRDAPNAAPTARPAGRPADAARQALRSARQEAVRAAAEETGSRRGTRTPARPATSSPASARPGEASPTARVKTAHDMRQFLTSAFRMPSSADTPQDTDDNDAPGSDTGLVEPRPPAPAPPQLPATMATPHRDSELRRTFPAFPARATSTEDSSFAETWWGNAWVNALEQGALDVKRLVRGRGYADHGHVDAITVTPGLVLAYVRGSRPRPYRVQVRLRTLEGEGWERFLDAAADRPGHIAALLDKELPQSLADCGVPLLPGPGDLAPRCSCPDSGHPCKHAAALCYQTARLLDADPFVLLLLRGRGEKELLDALSRRSAARAARAAQQGSPRSLPGVRAADALAPRRFPPLPGPLPVPPHPEQPPVYPAAPGGPDPFALDQLATDAAARAHALLATGRDPVGELTLWQDAVRLAAARPGSGLTATTRTLYSTLAAAVGRTPADLARAVAAWRQGGLEALAVLEEPWDPPAGRFDRARPLLLAADLPAFRPWRNHLTHPRGHVQLRLGRDGLWYAYESEPGHDDWWPRGTPDLDPVGTLTGLGTPDDL